jgi:hypothetical protein
MDGDTRMDGCCAINTLRRPGGTPMVKIVEFKKLDQADESLCGMKMMAVPQLSRADIFLGWEEGEVILYGTHHGQ